MKRGSIGVLAIVPFLLVVAATTVGFGIGSHLSTIWAERDYTFWSLVMLIGITGLVASCLPSATTAIGKSGVPYPGDTAWVVLCGSVSVSLYLSLPTRTALGIVTLLWLVAIGVRLWRRDPFWPFAAAFAAMVALMVWSVIPMRDSSAMDLLPITKAAIRYAFQGIDPYRADYTNVTPNPFFYLPGEWITYAPFELLRINLCWINFGCWLAIIGLFEGAIFQPTNRAIARTFFYPVIAAFPVIQAMATEVPPMWLGLTVFMLVLLRGRQKLAAFTLGALVVTSQLMLAVAMLSGAYFLRTLPPRRFLACVAIAAAVMFVVLAPFVLFSSHFLRTVFIDRPRIATETWEAARNAYNSVGLNNLLVLLHLQPVRPYVQIAVLVAGAILLIVQPPRSTAEFLYISGVFFLCAVALNGQILRYYYYPPLLMIACGGGLSLGASLSLGLRDMPKIAPDERPQVVAATIITEPSVASSSRGARR